MAKPTIGDILRDLPVVVKKIVVESKQKKTKRALTESILGARKTDDNWIIKSNRNSDSDLWRKIERWD